MKLKFAIVGPSGGGKTTMTNLLASESMGENPGSRVTYRPTHSVRIVEFSLTNIDVRKYNVDIDAQLWEIGGNPKLKAIWSAVQTNLDGVVLVYDVNNEVHIREASAFNMHFVTHSNNNISPAQCLVVGNVFRGQRQDGPQKIVGIGPRVRHIAVNLDDDYSSFKEEFKLFTTGVAQIVLDKEKANVMA